jgi:hypothetical protein
VTRQPPSLQTFAEYGQRFGGIEPHFKDCKSATFDLTRSHIRDPEALGCLLMLIAAAQLFAISFLQLGLRELKRRIYLNCDLSPFTPLPYVNPPPAAASPKKRAELADRIECSRVTVFNF